MAKKTIKKTASAGKSNTKPKKSSNLSEGGLDNEILTIISAVIGLFIMLSMWFHAGGIVGKYFNMLLGGLFGNGAYILPVALIGIAVYRYILKDHSKTPYIIALFVLLCFVAHYMFYIDNPKLASGLTTLWKNGQNGSGGGILGGIFVIALSTLLGKVTTGVLLIALVMIDIILLFRVSVISALARFFTFIFRSIKDCFKSVKEVAPDEVITIEVTPEEIENKRKNEWDDAPDITILPKNTDEEEEISISNPLDDFPFEIEEETHIPEIKEQLVLQETEESEESLHDMAPDMDIVGEIENAKEKPAPEYVFPTFDLLDEPAAATKGEKLDKLKENAAKLLEILQSFGIEAKISNVTQGSSVTRYEVVPAAGVKVNKITALDQDIAMRLPAQNVRIEVLPGSVSIEASNDKVTSVYIRDIIESKEFINHPSKLAVALGRDIEGKVVVVDIAKTPHLLIAGATGSGKSVCINAMITSLLYKSTPEEVRLVMVDPKVVELGMYNGIPHLLVPIVTDPRKAAGALCWAVNEMEDRYKKFADNSVRNLSGYNEKMVAAGMQKLPQIVIIIDELADLMMVAPGEVQDYICRLAQKARAAGMHLILATQRPSVDVITGLIKANIPSRFSFQVSSHIDSRTILDTGGAEKLMGRGDMLMMLSSSPKLVRVQGAYVSDDDVDRVTSFVKSNCEAEYSEAIQKSIEGNSVNNKGKDEPSDEQLDELFDEAVEIAFELDQISTSMLQRRLKIGYARAGRLIDLMDKMQIISPYDGSNKPRTLRMSREQFYAMRQDSSEED